MKNLILMVLATALTACGLGKNEFDAQGNFEADEVIVSSQAVGEILEFRTTEGDELKEGQLIGVIDTVALHLKKLQIEAVVMALEAKIPDAVSQIEVIKQQIETAEKEQARTANLLKSEAATQKQYDDITAQVELLKKQLKSTTSQLNTQTRSILSEIEPQRVQIAQIEDQIEKCKIKAPISGTVLSKFAQKGELASIGKPLYKIANTKTLNLRAYAMGDQLSQIKIGQSVKVYVDAPKGEYKEYAGTIIWVSSKSEFAPKVIQTKDERVNLVYAIKVAVDNDGGLKIGMPAEVKF